jgi:hypothetical protein
VGDAAKTFPNVPLISCVMKTAVLSAVNKAAEFAL